MIRLALLRHGPTVWNHEGRLQGRTDIPLHPAAIAELSSVALPPGWAAADIVTSPLKRARQTAELLVGGAARIEPALIEMNWGQFEGARGREGAIAPERLHDQVLVDALQARVVELGRRGDGGDKQQGKRC